MHAKIIGRIESTIPNTTRNMSIRDENLNDEKQKCHRIAAILWRFKQYRH